MDGGGRLVKPLKRSSRPCRAPPAAPASKLKIPTPVAPLIRRRPPLGQRGVPRGAGAAASALLVLGSIAYGAIRGDHVAVIATELKDTRDALSNAAGFHIEELSIAGRRQLTEKDVLAAAGVTHRTSLLFLDVEGTRARLQANPWIVRASVRKFYPGRLQIEIEEREPFALWQKDGKLSLVAADGTVLAPLDDPQFAALPLVVGRGAEMKAKGFLAVLARYPAIREQVRASILVAERRWNLKLANGIDVRLPEVDIERALDTLSALDRDKKLLSRDITAVDLRLADRVTVRLSDEAAQARDEALRAKKPKSKGGNA